MIFSFLLDFILVVIQNQNIDKNKAYSESLFISNIVNTLVKYSFQMLDILLL